MNFLAKKVPPGRDEDQARGQRGDHREEPAGALQLLLRQPEAPAPPSPRHPRQLRGETVFITLRLKNNRFFMCFDDRHRFFMICVETYYDQGDLRQPHVGKPRPHAEVAAHFPT